MNRRYYRLMFGFALPFALIMSAPLLGPLMWGVAQASAASLVVEINRLEHERKENNDQPAKL